MLDARELVALSQTYLREIIPHIVDRVEACPHLIDPPRFTRLIMSSPADFLGGVSPHDYIDKELVKDNTRWRRPCHYEVKIMRALVSEAVEARLTRIKHSPLQMEVRAALEEMRKND